jgi:hypothetical protein
MPTLDEALAEAFETAYQDEAPPLSSIGQLVDAMGGAGRGGGIGRVARELGVAPRTVERWFAFERGGPGQRRQPPTARTRGLTANQRSVASRIRGLWTDRGIRLDVLERRLRGRKLVVDFDITWKPYPAQNRPDWRDGGRFGPLVLPPHRAAPIIRDGLEGLRTGDADAWERAADRLEGELAGALGLPEEAEADEAHSLVVSFE